MLLRDSPSAKIIHIDITVEIFARVGALELDDWRACMSNAYHISHTNLSEDRRELPQVVDCWKVCEWFVRLCRPLDSGRYLPGRNSPVIRVVCWSACDLPHPHQLSKAHILEEALGPRHWSAVDYTFPLGHLPRRQDPDHHYSPSLLPMLHYQKRPLQISFAPFADPYKGTAPD
jgi:hypothetical protein